MDGARDLRLLELLRGRTPVSVLDVKWRRPIRISAYVGAAEMPQDLVTSVRCIVRIDDSVVLCRNRDGRTHAMPGGHRQPGESYADTARREVEEETGWLIDTDSLTQLGFLHLYNLGEPLDPYPHPDVLQLVTAAMATGRAAEAWTDADGYELSSKLVPLSEAEHHVSAEEAQSNPFLRALRALDQQCR